jgi:hypothetical protein
VVAHLLQGPEHVGEVPRRSTKIGTGVTRAMSVERRRWQPERQEWQPIQYPSPSSLPTCGSTSVAIVPYVTTRSPGSCRPYGFATRLTLSPGLYWCSVMAIRRSTEASGVRFPGSAPRDLGARGL